MNDNRCRIIVAVQPGRIGDDQLRRIASSGVVYCVLLFQGNASESDYERFCETTVPVFADNDIPVLIADDTRLMGRCGASGIFLERERVNASAHLARLGDERLVGIGAIKDRHMALELAELGPDFIFFGKPGGDIKPSAHPKNLAFAEWWSQIVEIPCVVMAGNASESVLECAKTGADFVCVGEAMFCESRSIVEQLTFLDQMLEAQAPRFEEVVA